jgi:hypothetical protein
VRLGNLMGVGALNGVFAALGGETLDRSLGRRLSEG